MNGYMKPQDIEKRSFEIITAELGERTFPAGIAEVVKRVIHTTADFDYADSLAFSPDVIEKAKAALAAGATVVTDTNMALSGVSKTTLAKLGGKAVCLMADEQVASEAKARGVTRAVVSMEHAAKFEGPLIFAIGNAPTALIRLHELIEEGIVRACARHRCAGRICQCGRGEGAVHRRGHAVYHRARP